MTEMPVEITIGSDIAEIPKVSARLEETMQAHGLNDEEILDTQLAIEEAITNIIVHGYESPDGIVALSLRFVTDGMIVTITDTAPPFDPLSLPDPALEGDVEDRPIGGLGVYLIRQVMNEVSYRFEDGKNIFTMTKRHSG